MSESRRARSAAAAATSCAILNRASICRTPRFSTAMFIRSALTLPHAFDIDRRRLGRQFPVIIRRNPIVPAKSTTELAVAAEIESFIGDRAERVL